MLKSMEIESSSKSEKNRHFVFPWKEEKEEFKTLQRTFNVHPFRQRSCKKRTIKTTIKNLLSHWLKQAKYFSCFQNLSIYKETYTC